MKPVSSRCNLDCEYCFYKQNKDHGTMRLPIVQRVVSLCDEETTLGWQGGEPTLAGLGFYEKVMECCPSHIRHSLMTNGILLNREWAKFLYHYGFLVGVSIDGPENIHNQYRNQWKQTIKGVTTLLEHGVQVNAVVTVNKANWNRGVRIYRMLVGMGIFHLQFIPVCINKPQGIMAYEWGVFLTDVFNEWLATDGMNNVSVQIFDECMRNVLNEHPLSCVFSDSCGGFSIEANGDVYCCEHFIDQDWALLGDIMQTDFVEMANSIAFRSFNNRKFSPRCKGCEFFTMCYSGCIKHRLTPFGSNIFCEGYKAFFRRFLAEIVPLR